MLVFILVSLATIVIVYFYFSQQNIKAENEVLAKWKASGNDLEMISPVKGITNKPVPKMASVENFTIYYFKNSKVGIYNKKGKSDMLFSRDDVYDFNLVEKKTQIAGTTFIQELSINFRLKGENRQFPYTFYFQAGEAIPEPDNHNYSLLLHYAKGFEAFLKGEE